MCLIGIYFVAHEGCTALVLMLLDGGGDLLAVEVNLDNLRVTAIAVTSHGGSHGGVYAFVDGILHLLNVSVCMVFYTSCAAFSTVFCGFV